MRICTLVFLISVPAFAEVKLPPAATHKIDFEKDVQPILAQKCHACHGDDAQQSGLRLDKRQNAMRGGDYGPVIMAGNSAGSKLILRLVNGDGGLQMPPTGPLSNEEIGILRAWIDQGADFRIQVAEEAPPVPVDPNLAGLIAAIRAKDLATTTKLLAANPELLNSRDRVGGTLLHHAAGFGDLATMKLLLAQGADANAGNKRKSTPLFWAISDEAKVRLLLASGANPNIKSTDGRTPLYQAANMPDALGTMRLLLDEGADANVRMLNGMTPLIAASRVSLASMRLLVERKADVKATNAAGGTALMAAAQTGRPDAVRFLLSKGADAKARTKKNETALADAATAGNLEVIQLLLDHGAEVNVQDARGYSALLYAAGSDTIPAPVVKLLLAKGADSTAKGDDETAAMLAAKRGPTEVARLLGVSVPTAPVSAAMKRRETTIAEAVAPAFDLLQKQSHNFIRIGGCNSCHAQDLPSAAAAIARHRGIPAPKEIAQLPQHMHTVNPERIMDLVVVGVASAGWEMFDFGHNGIPRDHYTDATARFMKAMQTADGHWASIEGRRPPMNAGDYQATALAVYTLKTYGPPAEKADTDKVLARAAAWLEAARPMNTQDRTFHLLGLAWSNARPAAVVAAANALMATQQADGGWKQMPTLPTDAYATGQALYALSAAARTPATHPTYAKGIRYLLDTQAADGSWLVKSRSIWVQPYFESGFPYAHDQWISAAGTSWATMALVMAAEPQRISANK